MMEDLDRINVPVLVFSAGLGDAVVAVLKQHNVLYPNVKVFIHFNFYLFVNHNQSKRSLDSLLKILLEPIVMFLNCVKPIL